MITLKKTFHGEVKKTINNQSPILHSDSESNVIIELGTWDRRRPRYRLIISPIHLKRVRRFIDEAIHDLENS